MASFDSSTDYDDDDTAAVRERAEGIAFAPLDQDPVAKAQPTSVVDAWTDLEFEQLAQEQPLLQRARGEAIARPHSVESQRVDAECGVYDELLKGRTTDVHKARHYRDAVRDEVAPHVIREPHAKRLYWTVIAGIAAGDVAGTTGAAVFLGEDPWLAVAQGVSIGLAAITAGFVGNEVKAARMSRRRQSAKLPERWQWRTKGGDPGERIVGATLVVSALVTASVCAGIYMLRAATQGSYVATAFGAMAVAICLASYLNRFAYADEFADIVESAEKELARAEKAVTRLGKQKALATRGSETEMAASIEREHNARAEASGHHLRSYQYGIKRNNVSVFGHGRGAPARRRGEDLEHDFERLERELRPDADPR